MNITKPQLDKAIAIQPQIKKALAETEMGVPSTLAFACWHVLQLEHLENQIENMQKENEAF